MKDKTKTILLLAAVAVLLGYLGLNVRSTPYPEQVVILSLSVAACPAEVSGVLQKEPGVLGIASVAETGETHVGISRATTPEAAARKLAAAGVAARVTATLSPVEYHRKYGHYFQTGTFTSCRGGCRK